MKAGILRDCLSLSSLGAGGIEGEKEVGPPAKENLT